MRTRLIFGWFVAVSPGVLAQSLSSSSPGPLALLAQIPPCALSCLTQALAVSTCSPTNITCTCTDVPFIAQVESCIPTSCSIKEALAAKNISQNACGAPERDIGQSYNVLNITLITISALLVAVRFVFKLLIAESGLGWDDWFILVTTLMAIASAVLTTRWLVPHGLGRDIWTLTPENLTNFGMYFYIMAILYVTIVAILKMSLLCFYLRISPDRTVKRVLWGLIALNGTFGVTYAILTSFICRPVCYFWTRWDGEHKGTCLNVNASVWANATISILVDLLMLAVPLWLVWGLHMHWKKKVGVIIMFCTGTFITIVSIIRLQSLIAFASSYNLTWDYFGVAMWSSIEISVGIICACMPTLRLMLVRYFPALSGHSRNTQYYDYKCNGQLAGVGSGSNRHHVSARSAGASSRAEVESRAPRSDSDKTGIEMERTFDVTVTYGESDETMLVELKRIPTAKDLRNAVYKAHGIHVPT